MGSSTKVASLNVRGLNEKTHVNRVQEEIQQVQPSLIVLTHVKLNKLQCILHQVWPGMEHCNNHNSHPNEKILVLWDPFVRQSQGLKR